MAVCPTKEFNVKSFVCYSMAAGMVALCAGLVDASPIQSKWASLGREKGFLGQPATGELVVPNRSGRYMHFAGGSIYWSPASGAQEVHGDIREKWSSLGWETSFLGYPVTDETGTPDGVGRFNHFQGGSIYWTPETGAHEVHGDIRQKWADMGWERSFLGYPISDELDWGCDGGRVSYFQGGAIYWTPRRGAWAQCR